MVKAFELYGNDYSRADGMNVSYDDVKSYLSSIGDDETGGVSISSNAQLKQIIKEAIRESGEDKIAFTLFNHDFSQSDVAIINMVLNTLAILLAIVTLVKKR